MRWRNVPIPEPHVGGLIAGILLHVFVPWRLAPDAWMGHAIGWPLVLSGLVLAVWSIRTAGAVDMERPGELIVGGSYAHSRNPMYVAWTLLYVGVGLVINAAWILVLLPVVLVLIHSAVRSEERSLAERFGDEYRAYAARTRRYV